MANEITLVNGVTKYELQGSGNYRYLFPLAQIVAYPNADPNEGYYDLFVEWNNTLKIKFEDITDDLGAADIVEYVDLLATNTYYFNSLNAGSIAPSGATGWVSYVDNLYTSSNKFSISEGATEDLPNNAATTIDYQLNGIPPLYNPLTTKITPENDGDAYMLRVAFKAENDNISGLINLILDIGFVIFEQSFVFSKGANTEHSFSETQLVYARDTFKANGGQLQILSVTGDTEVWDITYTIDRIHKAV